MRQKSVLRDKTKPVPSCDIVAEVSALVTGKKPYWSECTDYPAPDPKTHIRKCMQSFAPAYYGANYESQISTCSSFQRGYEIALKSANNRHTQRLPDDYVPPSCDDVNSVIASLTGGGDQWLGCVNYDATRVRQHLLACVASDRRDFLQLRDCAAVRNLYEERLRATHGGLPQSY